jgi:hypothetical protein
MRLMVPYYFTSTIGAGFGFGNIDVASDTERLSKAEWRRLEGQLRTKYGYSSVVILNTVPLKDD